VLRKAMSKNAAERYASCTQFVAALDEACDARPGWRALRRGSSASLPTMVDALPVPPPVPEPIAPPPAAGPPATPAAEPVRHHRPRYGDDAPRQPRRTGWLGMLGALLLGAGVVAGVFYGTAKYLENQNQAGPAPPAAPQPAAEKPAPKTEAPPTPGVEAAKPSPMSPAPPVEEPPAEQPVVMKPAADEPPAPKPSTVPAKARKEEPTAPAEQIVLIRSTPPGARVIVDDRADWACTTPCSLPLPHGRHALSAVLQGYHAALRVFEVPKQSELYLSLGRTGGTLIVKTTPVGATISINGQARPEKTPAMIPLAPGRYKVTVSLAGYKDDDQDINVRDGAMLEANFTLGR